MTKTLYRLALSILRNFADERLREENERLAMELTARRDLDRYLTRMRERRVCS